MTCVIVLTGCSLGVPPTPKLHDTELESKVYACAAGFGGEISASLSAEFDKMKKEGRIGVVSAWETAAAFFFSMPEKDRVKAYELYLNCLQLDKADQKNELYEFKKEKYDKLAALKEELSETSFKLNPDERQEIQKGTKKGQKVFVGLVDQVVKEFTKQSRLWDSHQHLFSKPNRQKLKTLHSNASKTYNKVHKGISDSIAQSKGTIGEQNGQDLKKMLISMSNFLTEFSNSTTQELDLVSSQI